MLNVGPRPCRSSLDSLHATGLAGNRLTSLPEEICQLGALRLLALPCNRLESLPSKLNHLGELLSLLLDDNRLTTLPDEIEQARPAALVMPQQRSDS